MTKVLAAIAILLRASVVADAQHTFVALGWERTLELGRELRSDRHRVGVRAHVDYTRRDISRPTLFPFPADTGPFLFRSTSVTQQTRAAGFWLTARYTPIRWRLEPYILGGIGIRDMYVHGDIPALDSATIDDVKWPSQEAYSYTSSRWVLAIATGLGLSLRVDRLRVFGELRAPHIPVRIGSAGPFGVWIGARFN